MTRVLAIDPGLSGGYALLEDYKLLTAGDMPRVGDGSQSRISGALFGSLIKEWSPDCAVIEEVSAMPKQGVSSTFRFGRAVGAIEGVITGLNIPIHAVTPGRWKTHFRLNGKGNGGAEYSRQRAIQEWPSEARTFQRKKDHNRAEAALIGLWFVETQHRPQKNQHSEPGRVASPS